MKKLNVTIISIILPLSLQASDPNFNYSLPEKPYNLENIANKTCRRFYFVARLNRTIEILKKIHDNNPINKEILWKKILNFSDSPKFEHKTIQKTQMIMKNTFSINKLVQLWEKFINYEFLEDDLFLDEFNRSLFVITRNLLLYSLPQNNRNHLTTTIQDVYNNGINKSALHLPDFIDLFINEYLRNLQNKKSILKKQYKHMLNTKFKSPLLELEEYVHTEEIARRFYGIYRLTKAINVLKSSNINHVHLFQSPPTNINPLGKIDNTLNPKNDAIFETINDIETEHTIEPLYDLWDEFTQFKYANDPAFIKDFSKLIFVIVKNITTYIDKDIIPNEILNSYNHLHQLSRDQILHSIDITIKHLEHLQQKETTSSKLIKWLRNI